VAGGDAGAPRSPVLPSSIDQPHASSPELPTIGKRL